MRRAKSGSFSDSEFGDPREELSKYYSLSGEIPESITRKVLAKIPSEKKNVEYLNEVHEESYQNERKMITQMLHDNRISLQQRENIAQSILHGKYQITPEVSKVTTLNSIQATEKDIVHTRDVFLDLNRHHLRKPHFLQIVTERSKIPVLSAKAVHEEKMEHLRRSRTTDGLVSPTYYKNTKQKEEDARAHLTKEAQNKLLLEDKNKRLKQAREESLFNTEEALRMKKEDMEGTNKKVAIKKRLAQFRAKLKEHLEKRNDPQIGQIMRCIDESMVYYFMEKFEGYTMSVEAILALIGNSLGTSMVAPDPAVLSTERDIVGKEKRNVGRNKHTPMNIETVTNTYAPGKNYPNPRTLNAVVFDTVDFDTAAAERRRRAARNHPKGLSDPVMGIAPRKYHAPQEPARALSPKAMGGGFRTESREGRPLEPMAEVDGTPQYFAVLGSDQVHNSLSLFRKEYFDDSMQFSSMHPSQAHPSHSHSHSHHQSSSHSHPQHHSHDGDDISVRSISVMKGQMIEEESLPSMQPEKVLSEQQLHDLGHKLKTFEEIMLEMNPHYRFDKKRGVVVNKAMSALQHFHRKDAGPVREEEELSQMSVDDIETKTIQMNDSRPITPGTPKNNLNRKPLPLIGSVLSPSDRERFDQYTSVEIDYFRHSIGPNAVHPPPDVQLPKTPVQVDLTKPPKGIKTNTKYASKDGLHYLPISPYKSFEEEMNTLNRGIPAGAGLALWRPHQKVTQQGRYRAGQSGPLREKANKEYRVPFVSGV